MAVSINALAGMSHTSGMHAPLSPAGRPAEADTIKPRYTVKRTVPNTENDLKRKSMDLRDP